MRTQASGLFEVNLSRLRSPSRKVYRLRLLYSVVLVGP